MPKKSKPKQRTNWKQRALHCEEVIKIQNVVAESREKWAESLSESIKYWEERAESAEKHNALLLEEREAHKPLGTCESCGKPKLTSNISVPSGMLWGGYFCGCPISIGTYESAPTHWQRFKSWLSVWKIAVLFVAFILCGVAAFVAFVWKQGG